LASITDFSGTLCIALLTHAQQTLILVGIDKAIEGTLLAERSTFAALSFLPWEGFCWNFVSHSFSKCTSEMQLWLQSVS